MENLSDHGKHEQYQEGITKPIESAKDFVGQMIEKMKSFFKFSGNCRKSNYPIQASRTGVLGLPKIVEWYDKGGILRNRRL